MCAWGTSYLTHVYRGIWDADDEAWMESCHGVLMARGWHGIWYADDEAWMESCHGVLMAGDGMASSMQMMKRGWSLVMES